MTDQWWDAAPVVEDAAPKAASDDWWKGAPVVDQPAPKQSASAVPTQSAKQDSWWRDLPESEHNLSPKDVSLNTMIPFYPQLRAAELARERGEGSLLWNLFNTGTPQHVAEQKALQQRYAEAWENSPDEMKVLSVAGLPGGMSPIGAMAGAAAKTGRPIAAGATMGGGLGFFGGYTGETGTTAERLKSGLKGAAYGGALGAYGGALQHGANVAQEGVDNLTAIANAEGANKGNLRSGPITGLPKPPGAEGEPPAPQPPMPQKPGGPGLFDDLPQIGQEPRKLLPGPQESASQAETKFPEQPPQPSGTPVQKAPEAAGERKWSYEHYDEYAQDLDRTSKWLLNDKVQVDLRGTPYKIERKAIVEDAIDAGFKIAEHGGEFGLVSPQGNAFIPESLLSPAGLNYANWLTQKMGRGEAPAAEPRPEEAAAPPQAGPRILSGPKAPNLLTFANQPVEEKQEEQKPAAAEPRPHEAAPVATKDLDRFSSDVNSLLGGSEKMPISSVYDMGVAKGMDFGSLDDFKRTLGEAAKEGKVDLERHDIAGGMDPRSETPFGRDVRHYVVNPSAAPAEKPAPQPTNQQPKAAEPGEEKPASASKVGFAARVADLLNSMPDAKTASGAPLKGRVAISDLWDAFKNAYPKHPDSEHPDAFKNRLVQAAKDRLLSLGRADLPERLTPDMLQKSATKWGREEVHFVNKPDSGLVPEDVLANMPQPSAKKPSPISKPKEKAPEPETQSNAIEKESKIVDTASMDSKQLIDRAVKRFGITHDPNEAGYVLPDGRLLDFSNGESGERIITHEIADKAIGLAEDAGHNGFLGKTNSVRMNTPGAVEFIGKPTPVQIKAIVNANRGSDYNILYVDRTDPATGRVLDHFALGRPTVDKLSGAIEKSFKEKPASASNRGSLSLGSREEGKDESQPSRSKYVNQADIDKYISNHRIMTPEVGASIAPSEDRFLYGDKPIYAGGDRKHIERIFGKEKAKQFDQFPSLRGSYKNGPPMQIWYKPGEEARAKEIARTWADIEAASPAAQAEEINRYLSKLYGYSDEEIDKFFAGERALSGKGAEEKPKPISKPKEKAPEPEAKTGEPAFAEQVTDLVSSLPDTKTASGAPLKGRIAISDAFDAYRKTHPDVDLKTFKDLLVAAAKDRQISLGRADLPERLKPQTLQRSATKWGREEVHFVNKPESGLISEDILANMKGEPEAKTKESGVGSEILKSYFDLAGKPSSRGIGGVSQYDWVPIEKLRAANPEVNRETFNKALRALYLEKKINLTPEEDQGTLTPDRVSAALPWPGTVQGMHYVAANENAKPEAKTEEAAPKETDAKETFKPIPHGTELTAKHAFSFKSPATGRKVNVKDGEVFWVTSSSTMQARTGAVSFARKNQSQHYEWAMPPAMLAENFHIEGSRPEPTEKPKAPETFTDRKGREWKPIGKNSDGQDLFEDQRGVRSYVEDGIRHTEPVSINPRGSVSVNRANHPEYEVAPAPKAEEKPTKQPEKSTKEPEEGPKEPHEAFVAAVRKKLEAGEKPFRTIVEARTLAKAHGVALPEGESLNKFVDELVERAVVETARGIVERDRTAGVSADETFKKMVALYDNQPNLSTRTSTSVAEQAYSTPAPLAYVASRLAGIGPQTRVLEPTAGNGMLLMEASPKKARVNELNVTRANGLKAQGFNPSIADGTRSDIFADSKGKMDAVIANPPFGSVHEGGSTKVFKIDGYNTTQIDHAISLNALKAMKDDGRAVLIIGGIKAESPVERAEGYGQKTKRRFFHELYKNYKVSDIFTVPGDLYVKQGAGWPVDVVVIDGKGQTENPPILTKDPPPLYKTWAEVGAKLNDAAPNAQTEASDSEQDSEPSRNPSSAGGRPEGANGVGGEPSSGSKSPEREPKPKGSSGVGGGGSGSKSGSHGGKPSVGAGEGEPSGEGGDVPEPHSKPDTNGGRPLEEPEEKPAPEKKEPSRPTKTERETEEAKDGQVSYNPASKKGERLNTLAPANLNDAMRESLDRLQAEHGPVDHYVARELGRKVDDLNKVFSAEQIDAIGLAISNVQKGEGFIIGDQTGLGKGRVVAAMITYAHRRGLTPVFVTEKPDLYGDMWRDLTDIKWSEQLGRPIDMVMTNANTRVALDKPAVEWMIERDEALASGGKTPPKYGQFSPAQTTTKAATNLADVLHGKKEPDVIFTTYDQMNSVKGKETDRRDFLRSLAPRAFLIMDEAHNAGGSGASDETWRAKDKAPPRSELFREAVQAAPSVMYSSATYAKTPEVMTLYSKTDMSKAVEDPKQLPELISKGGVPLQQVVASMLAKSGQYMRRERSFEGVSYDNETVPVNGDAYAEFSNGLRSVFQFDRAFDREGAKDNTPGERFRLAQEIASEKFAGTAHDTGVGEAAASTTSFSGIMHNIINQMIVAMKAKQAGERAVEALRAGEKPVIALSKTNASFIGEYMEANGLKVGDTLDISFADILRRYLERTRRVSIKLGDDRTEHVMIPVSRMSPKIQRMYRDAEGLLSSIDVGDLPISPVDVLRKTITDAGYTVREITGRDEMLDYSGGTPTIVRRPAGEMGSTGKAMTKELFNNGGCDAVILNKSGSTGISLHASKDFKDQRRRRMIILEADPNIDTHMQMLGRVHRTGQVITPAYTHLTADIPAEVRPTAVLMRKMASLNANTTGAAKSRFSSDSVDFLNKYGDAIAYNLMQHDQELSDKLGEPIRSGEEGSSENAAAKVTGRLTLLAPDEQQELLDRITREYTALIAELDATGENDLEAKHLDLQAKILGTEPLKEAKGPSPFQGAVNLDKVSVKSQGRAMVPDEVSRRVSDELNIGGGGDFVKDMPALESAGREKQKKFIDKTREKAANFVKNATKSINNPENKRKAEEKANDDWVKWRDLANIAHVGARVQLDILGEKTPAIVIGFEQNKDAKNPLALSSWQALFAVPTSMRSVGVPLSRLVIGSAAEKTIGITSDKTPFDTLNGMFEAAHKEGRETRYMISGNILAGYDLTSGKGQIVTHTMEDGTVRPAVLMNRGFKPKEFMEERPVRFEDGEHVLRFLDASKYAIPIVKSTDGVITISVPSNRKGTYSIVMPSAASVGGKYYRDKSVRDVYDYWEKKGSVMKTAPLSPTVAQKVIDALRGVGAVFETRKNQDLANSTKPGQQQGSDAKPKPEEGMGRTFALRADTEARTDAVQQIAAGQTVRVPREAVALAHEAMRPYLKAIPEGVSFGALKSLKPGKLPGEVVATFEHPNGSTFTLSVDSDTVFGARAFFDHDTRNLVSFRLGSLDLGSDGVHGGAGKGDAALRTLSAEIAHELVHAVWADLPAFVKNALVSHSDSLGIMDGSVRDYLKTIGEPSWKHAESGVSVRESYESLYEDLPDRLRKDAMKQEAATHLMELYRHGALSDEQIAPVKNLLDGILKGRFSKKEVAAKGPTREELLTSSPSALRVAMAGRRD
jgi:hypothetical protein